MIVQCNRRRSSTMEKGTSSNFDRGQMGNAGCTSNHAVSGGDHATMIQNLVKKSSARLSTVKEGVQAKSADINGCVSVGHNAWSGSGGSRFAHLNVEMEEEEMDVEEVAGDGESVNENGVNALNRLGSTSTTDKGKGLHEDKVVMAVSHPQLAEGMEAPMASRINEIKSPLTSLQRTMKEKVLKDVTNKLEPKPVKLKTNWAGAKNRPPVREVGMVNEWVSNNPAINSYVVGPNETSVLKNKGPILCSQPDPTQLLSVKDALAGTCPNSGGAVDLGGGA